MDNAKTGGLIAARRRELSLTQKSWPKNCISLTAP